MTIESQVLTRKTHKVNGDKERGVYEPIIPKEISKSVLYQQEDTICR